MKHHRKIYNKPTHRNCLCHYRSGSCRNWEIQSKKGRREEETLKHRRGEIDGILLLPSLCLSTPTWGFTPLLVRTNTIIITILVIQWSPLSANSFSIL